MENKDQPIVDDIGGEFQRVSENRKEFLTAEGEYDVGAWCEFNQQYNEFINHSGKREYAFIEKIMLI